MTIYLVWSNDAGSWWRANGAGYTGNVWEAGRYDATEAAKACSMRTWSLGVPPPEVMVIAPEVGQPLFAVEDILAVPEMMRRRIADATQQAIARRDAARPVDSLMITEPGLFDAEPAVRP